jgi:hypothetical protein
MLLDGIDSVVHVPNCKSFLVTEAERKHVGRRASLVAVACFLPGQAKDLSAPLYKACKFGHDWFILKGNLVEEQTILTVPLVSFKS